MGTEIFFNDPGTTLASNCTSGATTISVTSSSGYPTGNTNFRAAIGSELMLVTNVTGTTWTVTRGIEGTAGASHTSGDAVNATVTADALSAIIQQANLNLFSAEDRARAGGQMAYTRGKNVAVTSGSTQTILSYSGGPGYVCDWWLGLGSPGSGKSWQWNATIVVDGVTIYDGPQQNLFCATYWTDGINAAFTGDYFENFGGQHWMVPIPFSSSISITVTNNSTGTLGIWWTLQYVTGVPNIWPRAKNLKIAWGASHATAVNTNSDSSLSLTQDQVGTLLNLTGLNPGRLWGIYLLWEGAAVNNDTFLEGSIQISLDGTLIYKSSGIEDYMSMSGYFSSAGPGSGNRFRALTLRRDTSTPLYAFYRMHIPDPFLFENALKIEVQAGDSSAGFGSFTGAVLLGYMVIYSTD